MNILKNTYFIGFIKNDFIVLEEKDEVSFVVRYDRNLSIIWKRKCVNVGNNFIYKNKILLYEEENTSFLDAESGEVINQETNYYIKNNCNHKVYFELTNTETLNVNGYKIDNYSRLKRFNHKTAFFSDFNEPFIKAINFVNNVELFSFNTDDYFDKPSKIYEGRVLVVGERLIFFAHTEDWEQYATFILDAKTGEIINDPKETIFGGKLYLFDNYIWQKKDKGFAKMNPLTLEITHYDLSHELSTEIIDNHTMAYHNGIIAVSAKPEKGSIRSLVLLFDTKQGKIIWKQEILHDENKPATNENRRQIEAIQINEKYLAVSTTGYSLYIFEREG